MSLIVYIVGLVILLGCCAFCWSKGGVAERWGAILILVANVLADVIALMTRPNYPYFAEFVVDFGLAFGLLYLALRFNSAWLGIAMLLQSLVIGSYAFQSFGDGLQGNAYRHWGNLITVTMLLSITAGAVGAWRRRIRAAQGKPPRSAARLPPSVPA